MPIDPKPSFINFVYPFLFDPGAFDDVVEHTRGTTWQLAKERAAVWEARQTSTEDWLPHVANYLNLPSVPTADDQAHPGTAHLWRLSSACLDSPRGLGATKQVDWQMTFREPPTSVGIALDGVDLALFSLGAGFLTFKIKVRSDRVEDWLDVHHFGRFLGATGRAPLLVLNRRTGPGTVEPFFPDPQQLLAASAEGQEVIRTGQGRLRHLVTTLLASAGFLGADGPQVREVYVRDRLLPFAVVYLDEAGINSSSEEVQELLYQLRRMFHSQQPLYPVPSELRPRAPHYLPYARDQWFWFSLEGGGFLAVNAPDTDFFRQELPAHLDEQYFLTFLLALQQRFVLMDLSDDVARNWRAGDRGARREVFTRISAAFLDFTARGYFVQVMQRENHHRCYRRWQRCFQISRLYAEVREEVREMHDSLQKAFQERRGREFNRLTLLFSILYAAPALALAFLSINLKGLTTASEGLSALEAAGRAGVIALGLFPVFWLLWWLLHESD